MVKKIILLILIIYGAIFFYNRYLASTFGPFFRKNIGQVDLFQKSTSLDEVDRDKGF